jgi:hypothetical protein
MPEAYDEGGQPVGLLPSVVLSHPEQVRSPHAYFRPFFAAIQVFVGTVIDVYVTIRCRYW